MKRESKPRTKFVDDKFLRTQLFSGIKSTPHKSKYSLQVINVKDLCQTKR